MRATARVVLLTGKGGVGKTTVAAATALRCADAGKRTVLVSTDPAHSLADAFDVSLGSEPSLVTGKLWAQQLDATERLEEAWGDIQGYVRELLGWAGVDGIEAEELSVLPGLDELFALADIRELATSGAWDVVVVDCAPTAETLRFLSLPDVLGWYMNRVFPATRRLNKLVRPIATKLTNMPVAADSVFAAASRFYERLAGVRELLTDGKRATVRLVVNPERMVIAEARRTATYLALFGYRVDAVVANRLLPEDIVDPWFKAWKETHAEHLATIVEGFAPLPILRAELAPEELVGADALRAFGDALYGDTDAAAVLHEGDSMAVVIDGDEAVLRLTLPFAEHDDLEVGRRDEELLIRVGPYRRAVMLPDSLVRREVSGAALRDGHLNVTFGPRSMEGAST